MVRIEIFPRPRIKNLDEDTIEQLVGLEVNAKKIMVDSIHEPVKVISSGLEGKIKAPTNISHYEIPINSLREALKESYGVVGLNLFEKIKNEIIVPIKLKPSECILK